MSNKIIIYLAELAHNGFGLSLNTIPLGIGVIGSYVKKLFGDQIDVRLFRQYDDLMAIISERPPHIVGFGYYSWNDNLTLAASRSIRQMCPNALIVLGGPNISFEGWERNNHGAKKIASGTRNMCAEFAREYDLHLLSGNPDIDIIVHGDGEIPFSNIVNKYLLSPDRLKLRKEPIEGCTSLWEGELVSGEGTEYLYDLDQIPSPYLTGLYSDLVDRFQLIPQIETVRGCPYECAYCTIGGNTNKLRKHSLDYVKEELLYLKEHSPTGILRIADSNWGILKRDVELAEYIRDLHEASGFPSSLRVYYAEKGPFENVQQMAGALKTLLPLNMSFQTLTTEVLKNVRRKNMSLDKVKEMIDFAHGNDISVSTELISGLPGETYESFRRVFWEVVKLGFDSIYAGPLYLIKGSELYTNAARNLYGLKSFYTLIDRDVTRVGSRYVYETDEVVVESETMSEEDFWKIHKFCYFITTCYGAAFLKEIFMHCSNYDITPLEIYDELFGNPQEYPFFVDTAEKYTEEIKTKYFQSRNNLEDAIIKAINEEGNVDALSRSRLLLYYLGRTLSSQCKELFVRDIAKAALVVFRKKGSHNLETEYRKILEILTGLTSDIIISPMERVEPHIVRECGYDLIGWAEDDYRKPLTEFKLEKPNEFALNVRNIKEHQALFSMGEGMDDMEKFMLYYSTMVSSNMRRIISPN